MTIHILIKFKEHNYSQQGNPPPFSFSETIHITLVASMMTKWIWKYLQNWFLWSENTSRNSFHLPRPTACSDTEWPSEVATVGLYPHFVITAVSLQWKESKKWQWPLSEYLNSQNQFCFTWIFWGKVFSLKDIWPISVTVIMCWVPLCTRLWAMGFRYIISLTFTKLWEEGIVIGIVQMRKQAHRGKHSLSHVL